MDNELRTVNAKANAGMATGITALGIEALGLLSQNGGLGNLLGNLLGNGNNGADAAALIAAMNNSRANSIDTAALIAALNNNQTGADTTAILTMLPALMAMLASVGANGHTCNEDHLIDRYEAGKDAEIARLQTEVKLRDANTYTDQKMLQLYEYLDGQLRSINGQICAQAVKNQETADAFQLVRQDIARERDERKCADNTIVTYTNATFYPKQVADITTGTGTTAQTLYNPLPNCGC